MFVVVFRFVFAVVVVTGVVVVFVLITFVVFPHTVNVIAIMFAFLVLHQWFCGSIVAASWQHRGLRPLAHQREASCMNMWRRWASQKKAGTVTK